MVYILLAEGFEEAEALIPADLLRRAGLPVSLVGLNAATVAGGHGIAVAADLTLEQVVLSSQDMLLLPGGKGGVESMQMDLFALALIQKAHTVGCYLAAICAAPTLLAHLGLLDRRSAVCYPGMEGEMGSAVVRPECPVVVDGRIITARSAGCAFDFALKLIEILAGAEKAKEVQQLRKSARSLLTALSPEERTAGDRAMFQAFLSLPEVRQTGTFFLFWGIAGLEPDTGSLAASLTKLGKTVCLPRVVPGFGMECRVYRPELPMAISDFGIQEPTEQAPLIDRKSTRLNSSH